MVSHGLFLAVPNGVTHINTSGNDGGGAGSGAGFRFYRVVILRCHADGDDNDGDRNREKMIVLYCASAQHLFLDFTQHGSCTSPP